VRRPTIAWLLVAQATVFAAWWAVLVIAPASRAYFHCPESRSLGHSHEPTLLTFWLADAGVIATSLAAAFAVWRGRAWAAPALWAAAGGTGYAALYCVAHWIATGASALAVAMMVPSAALAIVLARAGTR